MHSAFDKSPANSHVRTARRIGLVRTNAKGCWRNTGANNSPRRSPSAVSGRSVRDVCFPLRLHSVSPWRTRKTRCATALGNGIGESCCGEGRVEAESCTI
jgi:hypothetical protein